MCPKSDIPLNENSNQPAELHAETLPRTFYVADAHCHPTDTQASLSSITSLTTTLICTMSTSFHDLNHVEKLYIQHPTRVVPAFGKKSNPAG